MDNDCLVVIYKTAFSNPVPYIADFFPVCRKATLAPPLIGEGTIVGVCPTGNICFSPLWGGGGWAFLLLFSPHWGPFFHVGVFLLLYSPYGGHFQWDGRCVN